MSKRPCPPRKQLYKIGKPCIRLNDSDTSAAVDPNKTYDPVTVSSIGLPKNLS